MPTFAGNGISYNKEDSYQAGVEAATSALKNLKGKGKPDFVFLFSTEVFDQQKLLEGVRSITGETQLAGCCTAGVIVNDILSTEAVGVMAIRSDEIKFYSAIETNIREKGKKAGTELANELYKKIVPEKYNSVVVLPNGIIGGVPTLINNMYSVLGARYRFSGGGAGDNLKFIKTYQFLNDKVYTNSVVAVAMISAKPQGIGVRHGWKPIGKAFIVTKSEGNIVRELDGRPAFEVYTDFFGKGVPNLTIEKFGAFAMKHPLGIVQQGEFIIRDPLKAEKDGSLVCVADVPENSVVRIMEGDKSTLIAAAREAAKEAMAPFESKPAAALLFDCVSRVLLYGETAKEEIEEIRKEIGEEVPLLGFSSFGEIGAIKGPPVFHNKTVTVHVI